MSPLWGGHPELLGEWNYQGGNRINIEQGYEVQSHWRTGEGPISCSTLEGLTQGMRELQFLSFSIPQTLLESCSWRHAFQKLTLCWQVAKYFHQWEDPPQRNLLGLGAGSGNRWQANVAGRWYGRGRDTICWETAPKDKAGHCGHRSFYKQRCKHDTCLPCHQEQGWLCCSWKASDS